MTPRLKIMGRKRGMTQIFDEKGNRIPCTVLEIEPNVVAQLKTIENDGYCAVQLAYELCSKSDAQARANKVLKKPILGHFEKAGVTARRHLQETRLSGLSDLQLGAEFGASHFEEGQYLDVTAYSKGKGFQGVMKLHGFAGGPAAHGSGFHRAAGSTGMRSTPGRCLPGSPRASQMGNRKKTVQNLKLIQLLEEDNALVVKGAVPGPVGALVVVQDAVKKPAAARA